MAIITAYVPDEIDEQFYTGFVITFDPAEGGMSSVSLVNWDLGGKTNECYNADNIVEPFFEDDPAYNDFMCNAFRKHVLSPKSGDKENDK